jgi:hypothetical protein
MRTCRLQPLAILMIGSLSCTAADLAVHVSADAQAGGDGPVPVQRLLNRKRSFTTLVFE